MSAQRRVAYAARRAWRTVRALHAGEIPLKSTHQLLAKLPSSSATSTDRHPQRTPAEHLGLALEPLAQICCVPGSGPHAPATPRGESSGRMPQLSPRPRNCEEAVIYLRSDNRRTFDAILMFGILPRLSSSRSVRELYAAMTQREASVERVCRYSQQLSCGGYK